MQTIIDKITEWLKGILSAGIKENLLGMFDSVNSQIGEIAGEVGKTPAAWNGGVFSMIQSLSENVIVPIAGLILTFVMCYELIQMVIDKNNLHDVDTWMFFKWIFKTFCAVLIVTNTWNIVMGVFDAAQSVVGSAAGVVISETSIDISAVLGNLDATLAAMELGPLFGLWFQSLFVGLTMSALTVCIFVVIYGRMIEIYLVTSIAPIPMATMINREWGSMGQNYLRSLLALAFQAFLIIVCVGIYAVLVKNIATGADIMNAIWTGEPSVIYGNVRNDGLIDNLPQGCCVEVACLVDANGIQPTKAGTLPSHLAALMQTNINVQTLLTEAILTENRDRVYYAAMMDPHTAAVLGIDEIYALVDDLIAAHGDWLPGWLHR